MTCACHADSLEGLERAVTDIVVVTYNIGGNRKAFSAEAIAAVLRAANADVVCLQEVCGESEARTQAHDIADVLRMNCVYVAAMARGEGGTVGNAVLSRFPLTRITRVALPQGSRFRDSGKRMPGQDEPRCAACALVCPFAHRPEWDFWCLSVHLGIYNTADALEHGHAPGARIAAFINDEQRKASPALLCGDLNALPASTVVERIQNNWNVWPDGADTMKGSGRIDYICDRGRGKWTMVKQEVIHSEASDHYALKAVWSPIVGSSGTVKINEMC